MLSLLLLGFSSGLPLPLITSTLQALLTERGVNLSTIGLFAFASLPYTVKFLWASFFDRFSFPFLGKRKGWIFFTQIILILSFPFFPILEISSLYLFVFLTAFFSASQDVVIDALRTEILEEKERGIGAAIFILGYRIALLISGAFALIFSDLLGWKMTYNVMSLILLVGVVGCLIAEEKNSSLCPQSLKDALLGPLKDLFMKRGILGILLFLLLYKLGDAYLGSMTTPFLLREIGFSAFHVGAINKGIGFFTLILGAFIAGGLMVKIELSKSLFIFGLFQMFSNLFFLSLYYIGKDLFFLALTVSIENLSSGMGTAAFVSLIMALCNPSYAATQFALLSSLASFGRVFLTPTSGFFVEEFGWPTFFIFSTLLALPGLLLLFYIRKYL